MADLLGGVVVVAVLLFFALGLLAAIFLPCVLLLYVVLAIRGR